MGVLEEAVAEALEPVLIELRSLRKQLEEPKRKAYSVTEAAQMIGVSPDTVRNWIASGKLRTSRPGGIKRDLITMEAIENLLK